MLERAFFLLLLRFVCPDKGKKHVVFIASRALFFFFLCDRLLEKTCLCSTTCRRSLKRNTCYCFPLPFFFPRFASRCFKGITPSSVRHMRRRCSCSRWCQQTFFSCYYLFFSELFVFYYYYYYFSFPSRIATCSVSCSHAPQLYTSFHVRHIPMPKTHLDCVAPLVGGHISQAENQLEDSSAFSTSQFNYACPHYSCLGKTEHVETTFFPLLFRVESRLRIKALLCPPFFSHLFVFRCFHPTLTQWS